MELIILSGQSGAGKSVALSILEDRGYYCIDNLPIKMLSPALKELAHSVQKIAISLDIRSINLYKEKSEVAQELINIRSHYQTTLLFFFCEPNIIINRYADTRRSHPLMRQDSMTLEQAICHEIDQLAFVRETADIVIDTSYLNIHQLTAKLTQFLELLQFTAKNTQIKLIFNSFGFKKTTPPSSNFVFDVRHLPNPFWDKTLAVQTGLNSDVISFFEAHSETATELQRIETFLNGWLNNEHIRTLRKFVVISIGCTGGQHRSVYIADNLAKYYATLGYVTQTYHMSLNQSHTYI